MVKALSKCVMPCMNKWEINWVGRAVPTSKNIVSGYFAETFTQYVLMDELPESLPVIRYFDIHQKRDIEVNIHRSEIVEGEQIFKLWAKIQIAELSMNREINSREIIEISKDYQVVSPITAFSCVKTQDGVVIGDLKTINIASRPRYSSSTPSGMPTIVGGPIIPMIPGGWMQFHTHHGPLPQQGGLGYPMGMPVAPMQMPMHMQVYNNSLPGYSPLLPRNPAPNLPPNSSMPIPAATNPPLPYGNRPFSSPNSTGPPTLPYPNIDSNTLKSSEMDLNMGFTQSPPQFTNPALVLGGINPIGTPPPFTAIPQGLSSMPPPPMNFSPLHMGSISKESKTLSIPNENEQKMEFMPNKIYFEITTKLRSEGYWEYNEVLPLFKELMNYQKEIREMEDNVVATIFILCYLAAKYSEKIDEWVLLQRKAINWLAIVGIDFETHKTLFTIN